MRLEKQLEIFIVTFNRSNALNKTLNVLLDKSCPVKNCNITVLDNNSNDSTREIVKELQQQHCNLNYLCNRVNIGGNGNIAYAFFLASKKYVWVLADDDSYKWDSFYEVEEAMEKDADAIMVSTYEFPWIDIAQFFIQATFLPSVIYKTSLINAETMLNMTVNIPNLFQHVALVADLINRNITIPIVRHGIVKREPNEDCLDESGKKIRYDRGYKSNSYIHPLFANMNWLSGYANSLYLISDKKERSYLASHSMFQMWPLTSAEAIAYNRKHSNNSIYNLCCIFCVLNLKYKIRFIINIIFYYSLYRIIYIKSNYKADYKKGIIYKQYRLQIFSFLKFHIFKTKFTPKKLLGAHSLQERMSDLIRPKNLYSNIKADSNHSKK